MAFMGECKCCTMKVKCAHGIKKIFISKAFLSVAMLLSQKADLRNISTKHLIKFHFVSLWLIGQR